MEQRKKRKIYRRIAGVLLAFVLLCSFLFTVSGGKSVPTWEDFFYTFGLSDHETEDADFVRILDVGEGDCALISSNGHSVLIDTGPSDCMLQTCNRISACGIRQLDVLLLTHFHADHIGGVREIIDALSPHSLIVPNPAKTEENTEQVDRARKAVRAVGNLYYLAEQGMHFNIGEFDVTVLLYNPDAENENDRSVIVMAKIGEKKFLFMGDAQENEEQRLLSEGLDLDCDVLKVGHHGAKTSTSRELLEACTPEYAAISCGLGNSYGHPHSLTLEYLELFGATVFRTDQDGTITFYVENGEIRTVAQE